ncbi:hypothetical protein [Leuconostoc citreum]
MFQKTNFYFKISYFYGAITPAIVLFSVSVGIDFEIILIELLIGVVLTLKLNSVLTNQGTASGGVTKKFENAEVAEKNGEVLSLIFGIIIPSVIVPGSVGFLAKILFFVAIQWIVYLLMVRSSSIFPNILFILFGGNVYKLQDGDYLIDMSDIVQHKKISIEAKRIGSSSMNNTYVVARRKDE